MVSAVAVRWAGETRDRLRPIYGDVRLDSAELELESVPWDLAPSVRQGVDHRAQPRLRIVVEPHLVAGLRRLLHRVDTDGRLVAFRTPAVTTVESPDVPERLATSSWHGRYVGATAMTPPAARGESQTAPRADLFRQLCVPEFRDTTSIPAIRRLDLTKNLSLWSAEHFRHGLPGPDTLRRHTATVPTSSGPRSGWRLLPAS